MIFAKHLPPFHPIGMASRRRSPPTPGSRCVRRLRRGIAGRRRRLAPGSRRRTAAAPRRRAPIGEGATGARAPGGNPGDMGRFCGKYMENMWDRCGIYKPQLYIHHPILWEQPHMVWVIMSRVDTGSTKRVINARPGHCQCVALSKGW